MKINKLTFLFITTSLLWAGCRSLPPGTPPKGPIVNVNQNYNTPLDVQKSIDKMTTAIATDSPIAISSHPVNLEIVKDRYPKQFMSELDYLTLTVFKKLLRMDMIDFNPKLKFEYRLYSVFSKAPTLTKQKDYTFIWNMHLYSIAERRIAWSYTAKITIPKTEKEPQQ